MQTTLNGYLVTVLGTFPATEWRAEYNSRMGHFIEGLTYEDLMNGLINKKDEWDKMHSEWIIDKIERIEGIEIKPL